MVKSKGKLGVLVVLTLGRLWQEDCKFEDSLTNRARLCLHKSKKMKVHLGHGVEGIFVATAQVRSQDTLVLLRRVNTLDAVSASFGLLVPCWDFPALL